MGNFDFGQFQQIMDYLSQKLSEGGALTPEEQQIYNQLTALAGQGLNLTNTGDFNSLYNAFNGLADQATKQAFEQQYGTGLLQNPDGTISFTRPGSLIEAMQRRGQSVNDGPAMALLSEGLRNYTQQLAQNKFNSMTNAYQDMTPIRAQNIQALTNAGNIASTAIGRRVPIVGAAISGARGAGEGDSGGEGINITGGPGGPKEPSFWDKYGGALIGLLGTGVLGIGGYALKKWWEQPKEPTGGNDLMREVQSQGAPSQPPSYMGSMRQNDVYDYTPTETLASPYGISAMRQNDPYAIDQNAFQGQPAMDYPNYVQDWNKMVPNNDWNAYTQGPPNYVQNWNQPQSSYDYSSPINYYDYSGDYGSSTGQYAPNNDFGWSSDYGNSFTSDVPSSYNWYDESY